MPPLVSNLWEVWIKIMGSYLDMYFNCLHCGMEKKSFPSSVNKYCSKACQKEFEYFENIKQWKEGRLSGNKGVKSIQITNFVKRYIEEKFENKCSECGTGKIWNGKPLTLQIEHCDGNSNNTVEDNLSLLCPNCHTQTSFYGSKNKGRGRGSIYKAGLV